MGKRKTTTTNTYTHIPKPETRDTTALRNLIDKADFSTPLVNSYGQMENHINNEYYEDSLPDEAVSRIKSGKLFNMKMSKGAALAEAKNREHEYKTANTAALAAGMQPTLVQSGGTQTQSGGFLGDLALAAIGAGGSVGSGYAS